MKGGRRPLDRPYRNAASGSLCATGRRRFFDGAGLFSTPKEEKKVTTSIREVFVHEHLGKLLGRERHIVVAGDLARLIETPPADRPAPASASVQMLPEEFTFTETKTAKGINLSFEDLANEHQARDMLCPTSRAILALVPTRRQMGTNALEP
ncbi:hypothetical protein [Mesorhizobium comanense]|uniref:hypothetical protein n=1 Tax=Mesorhizobium comanense TaxID=2502215 RepID=UPI0010F8B9DC|nr:hypothetical protein [Mesorhizobium comanense]